MKTFIYSLFTPLKKNSVASDEHFGSLNGLLENEEHFSFWLTLYFIIGLCKEILKDLFSSYWIWDFIFLIQRNF